MRFKPLAMGPVLAGCVLVAVTSCSTDERETEAGLAPTMSPSVTAESAYDIVKVPSMTIDGNLNDWANIASISMADNSGRAAGLDNTAKVKLAWNDTYLYAAYDVTDSELLAAQTARDHGDIYKDDAVELYIDPQGDGDSATSMTTTDYQFLANVRDALGDLRGNGTGGKDASFNASSFLAKAVTNGTLNASGADVGYAVEIQISWADLGVTPSAGHFMRMDLVVDDDDTANTTTEEFDWAGLTGSFNNPSGWKDVQLVNPPPPPSAYDIVKVPGMTIDGKLSDWRGVAAISMADDPGNGRGSLNNSAEVKLAWDNTYLYAAYDVTDTDLRALQTTRDHGDIYQDDAIELYIDPQGDGAGASSMTATDYQFLANVREAISDYKGDGAGGKDGTFIANSFLAQAVANGTVNASGSDTDYAVELRIAWSDLGVAPAAGHFMRIDPAVDDRDGNPPPNTEEFDWAGLSTFNNPSGWKNVKLAVDATAPAAPTNLVLTVVSSSQIDVSWTGSTSSDVSKYRIYRGTTGTPTLLTTLSGSPYQDTALTASTTYTYQVSAVDAAGNESAKTPAKSATTSGTTGSGVPFGPFNFYASYNTFYQDPVTPFNLTLSSFSAGGIINQINAARSKGVHLVTAMTGGSHDQYLTNGQFDMVKWKARMNTYNTSAIKAAVADAVADGTILLNSVMDEPNHSSWGGVMTHTKLDEMARYVKGIFPTLKTGVVVQWDWQRTSTYQDMDVLISQYGVHNKGPVLAYRDSAVASAQDKNVGLMFSMNVLNGGTRVPGWPEAGCPVPQTGGPGTSGGNCRMTAAQVRDFGNVLVSEPFACGLLMWEYESTFFGRADNKDAFDDVAATAAARPSRVCGK
jgi:hypothetical protein